MHSEVGIKIVVVIIRSLAISLMCKEMPYLVTLHQMKCIFLDKNLKC